MSKCVNNSWLFLGSSLRTLQIIYKNSLCYKLRGTSQGGSKLLIVYIYIYIYIYYFCKTAEMSPKLRRLDTERLNVWASEKYITTQFFYPEQWAVTLDVTLSGRWPRRVEGADGPRLRSWRKSKYTRLTNVESEYDPRTKKKRGWLNVLRWSCTSLLEAERKKNKDD